MFGDSFHRTSQEGVCECVPASGVEERYASMLRYLRKKHRRDGNDEINDDENVMDVVKKYGKKQGGYGRLAYQALKKYRRAAVRFDNIKSEL